MARYRLVINGFRCHNETWDGLFQEDGKRDEIFILTNVKVVDPDGTVSLSLNSESELMGDTWRQPNRVQVGSADGGRGGIQTGDSFPDQPEPWIRQGEPRSRRYPPYTVWEGDLTDGGGTVFVTPTVWEWDPGAGAWNGWLDWVERVDVAYADKAQEIVGGIVPGSKPILRAASLGVQVVGSAVGLWEPLGEPMRRPIGARRDPGDPAGFRFDPYVLALNHRTAEDLVGSDHLGLGSGTLELHFVDDPTLRGVYSLFVQLERVGGADSGGHSVQRDWRWCNRCQGLFWGPGRASSRCPAGDRHAAVEDSGSGEYALAMDVGPGPDLQSQWRWCSTCQGLYFGPQHGSSACPGGGRHTPPTVGSNYSLPHQVGPGPGRQDDWRWCNRCAGLFFHPGQAASVCPSDGHPHSPVSVSRSGNYSLLHTPN